MRSSIKCLHNISSFKKRFYFFNTLLEAVNIISAEHLQQ